MAFTMRLQDRFGRVINYLRISVTDRCNLRCQYCMPPEGVEFQPKREILTFEEIVRAVQVANELGIDRARLTGGEPLIRKGLPRLVKMLKRETDLKELAMTTNGLLLSRYAEELAAAGLDRVNVSVDSLDPERFREITRFGDLERVWEGIERAAQAGIQPVKINTLVLQGFNDDELEGWVERTLDHPLIVRFLELMPIGEAVRLNGLGRFCDLTERREMLMERYGLVPAQPPKGNGPARYWKVPGAEGLIGFITPISDRYCDTCSRIRLTSRGDLRPCLAYDLHVRLGEAIRRGDARAIRAGFLRAAEIKPQGHRWQRGQVTHTVMSSLGG